MDVTKRSSGYSPVLNLEEVIERTVANYARNRATRTLQPQDDSYPGQGYSFERRQVEEDNEVDVFSLPECEMPECGGFCHLYFPASASIEETRQPEGYLEASEDEEEGGAPCFPRETLRSESSSSSLNPSNIDPAHSSLHGSQDKDSDENGEGEVVDVDEKEHDDEDDEEKRKRMMREQRRRRHRFWT
ncbi:hypothetical protein EAF04_007119 [Stromatinia cepivora]|nr:hypothetical protein EAF04_007119 [Stromatinia cepivora]